MTVTNENGSLKVLLTEAETVSFCLDEVFLNVGSPSADAALLTLFKEAAGKARFKTAADRLIIEIYPIFTGGCEVLFIPDRSDKIKVAVKPITRKKAFITAEFSNSAALLDAIERLYSDQKIRQLCNSLYEKDGFYRLTFKSNSGLHKLSNNLAELSCTVYTSALVSALTSEHWKKLCDGTAIDTVGKALKRD